MYIAPSIEFSKQSGLGGTTVPPLAADAGNGGDAGVSAPGGG